MKSFIGLGANLGDRKAQLEKATVHLAATTGARILRASPVFTTPALVLEGAPESWRQPFLNATIEIEWAGSPRELLQSLKKIEFEMGRTNTEKWAPRPIDLDILSIGRENINEPGLQIPHPEIVRRQFVLSPLKHLSSSWMTGKKSALALSRALPNQLPAWMAILNATPDSFSDGGELAKPDELSAKLDAFDLENVQILDVGGESTRPGAEQVSVDAEWRRVGPVLELIRSRYQNSVFRPWVSVDTYRAATASRALSLGVELLNDVSGLSDPAMIEVLAGSNCQYVLMHSLSIPANATLTMKSDDPVAEVKTWAEEKLNKLGRAGINLDRVIFDPGIGFGKTTEQSLAILREVHRLFDLPVRILLGHSRKSFLNHFGAKGIQNRDAETLGLSLKLAAKGVDILRVHTPDVHSRAFRSFQEI